MQEQGAERVTAGCVEGSIMDEISRASVEMRRAVIIPAKGGGEKGAKICPIFSREVTCGRWAIPSILS